MIVGSLKKTSILDGKLSKAISQLVLRIQLSYLYLRCHEGILSDNYQFVFKKGTDSVILFIQLKAMKKNPYWKET